VTWWAYLEQHGINRCLLAARQCRLPAFLRCHCGFRQTFSGIIGHLSPQCLVYGLCRSYRAFSRGFPAGGRESKIISKTPKYSHVCSVRSSAWPFFMPLRERLLLFGDRGCHCLILLVRLMPQPWRESLIWVSLSVWRGIRLFDHF